MNKAVNLITNPLYYCIRITIILAFQWLLKVKYVNLDIEIETGWKIYEGVVTRFMENRENCQYLILPELHCWEMLV